MLAVPCGPAASGAEPGVLAARRERRAAVRAVPGISHPPMLRVTAGSRADATVGLVRVPAIGRSSSVHRQVGWTSSGLGSFRTSGRKRGRPLATRSAA
jgi:hypothetical protein